MKTISLSSLSLLLSVFIHAALFVALWIPDQRSILNLGGPSAPKTQSSTATEVSFVHRTLPELKKATPATVKIKTSKIQKLISKTTIKKSRSKKPLSKISSKQKIKTASLGTGFFNLSQQQDKIDPQLSRYFQHLLVKIEKQKHYPRMARRLHQAGRVVIRFEISKSGDISNVIVEKPCKFHKLNTSAKRLIEELKSTTPIPETLNYAKFSIAIPIEYRL